MKVARRTGLCSIIGVAALAVLALTPQLASATPTAAAASPGWPALQQQAAHAVAGSRHDGPVTVLSVLTGPAIGSSMALAGGGQVSSTAETVEAKDTGGSYVVNLDLLGGQQLVVTVVGSSSSIMVLTPGTSQVTQTVAVHSNRVSQATSGTTAFNGGSDMCFPVVDAPTVIGSIFGPLIDAYLWVDCVGGPYSISAYGALSEWVGSAKTLSSGGGGVYGYGYSFNLYEPCYASGINYFQDGLLASYNGSGLFGGTSPWIPLGCALL